MPAPSGKVGPSLLVSGQAVLCRWGWPHGSSHSLPREQCCCGYKATTFSTAPPHGAACHSPLALAFNLTFWETFVWVLGMGYAPVAHEGLLCHWLARRGEGSSCLVNKKARSLPTCFRWKLGKAGWGSGLRALSRPSQDAELP